MYWYVTLVERLPDGTTRVQGDLTVWAYSQAEAIRNAEAMVSGHPFDVRASGARLAPQGAGASGMNVLVVDDYRGPRRECDECQAQAYWLVREEGQNSPTFRCDLHLWYALHRVAERIHQELDLAAGASGGVTG